MAEEDSDLLRVPATGRVQDRKPVDLAFALLLGAQGPRAWGGAQAQGLDASRRRRCEARGAKQPPEAAIKPVMFCEVPCPPEVPM